MSEPFLIGLVGARGHTGRELIRLIADHPKFMLAYAVSREFAGRKVSEIAPEEKDGCVFEALDPTAVAARRADAVIIATPDGATGPYIEALERDAPHRIIVDLSADKRFDDDWAYGLPELQRQFRQNDALRGAQRIANPGCYATAMQLAIAPALPLLGGAPSVFGVSGYSGAGTKPTPRNDPARLADNLMAYKLVDHNHEREATRHLGRPVHFTPHVHPAFRGTIVTVHLPLAAPVDASAFRRLFDEAYAEERLVRVQDAAPEMIDGAQQNGVIIGGFSIAPDGAHAVCVAVIDNLLKGAAVQAVQNLNLAVDLPEFTGLQTD